MELGEDMLQAVVDEQCEQWARVIKIKIIRPLVIKIKIVSLFTIPKSTTFKINVWFLNDLIYKEIRFNEDILLKIKKERKKEKRIAYNK